MAPRRRIQNNRCIQQGLAPRYLLPPWWRGTAGGPPRTQHAPALASRLSQTPPLPYLRACSGDGYCAAPHNLPVATTSAVRCRCLPHYACPRPMPVYAPTASFIVLLTTHHARHACFARLMAVLRGTHTVTPRAHGILWRSWAGIPRLASKHVMWQEKRQRT